MYLKHDDTYDDLLGFVYGYVHSRKHGRDWVAAARDCCAKWVREVGLRMHRKSSID